MEPITFKKLFEQLNEMGNNSLFRFEGEKIIPLDDGVKFIFLDSFNVPLSIVTDGSIDRLYLYNLSVKFGGRNIFSGIRKEEIKECIKNNFEPYLKNNFVIIYFNPHSPNRKIIKGFANKFDDATICIHGETRSDLKLRPNWLVSTEELGTFISMLYFRERNYIVQPCIRSHGKEYGNGVDDVVAWKSPLMNKLRKHGFINGGCHISELACLRWLEKSSNHSRDFPYITNEELILTEVEKNMSDGLSEGKSQDKGINQLLNAKGEKIANKLFICFPVIKEKSEPKGIFNVDEIFEKIKKKTTPAVGWLLFDDRNIYYQDSEPFPVEKSHLGVKEYENNLIGVLLNNFYFDEILDLLSEFNIDTKNKGFEEVWIDFYNEVVNNQNDNEKILDVILDKLEEVMK